MSRLTFEMMTRQEWHAAWRTERVLRQRAEARLNELQAELEDYLLWRPGERGHAQAHRKLAALSHRGQEADE